MFKKLPEVDSSRGAPMGRPSMHVCPDDALHLKFSLERVPLIDGAYDEGGAYWGAPDNLYHAQCAAHDAKFGSEGDIEIDFFLRADSRAKAKADVRDMYPNATFKAPALTPFLEAYMTAALWSTTHTIDPINPDDEDAEGETRNLDDDFSILDIHPDTVKEMAKDCAKFQTENRLHLLAAYKREGYTESSAGHDFWLTRNGHGVGFWDRGLGVVGDTLTAAAKQFKECNLCIGDDNKIHAE